MDTTWIITIGLIAAVAAAGSLIALLRQRAPRVHVDPARLARLRDRAAERDARRPREPVDERIAEERPVRTAAPQRSQQQSAERLWAGGV